MDLSQIIQEVLVEMGGAGMAGGAANVSGGGSSVFGSAVSNTANAISGDTYAPRDGRNLFGSGITPAVLTRYGIANKRRSKKRHKKKHKKKK